MRAELLCLPQDSRAGHLSFYRKLCYGIGGVPNQVASSAIAFYLQLFLLDVAQVSVGSSLGVPYSHVWCIHRSAARGRAKLLSLGKSNKTAQSPGVILPQPMFCSLTPTAARPPPAAGGGSGTHLS